MAILGNPFVANVPKQLTPEELQQALRIDIAGELEAIIGYEAHASATSDTRARNVLSHIADEERHHVGELQQLLYTLCPKEEQCTEQGKQEVIQNFKNGFVQ